MKKSVSLSVLDYLRDKVPHDRTCLGSNINRLDCTCGLTVIVDKAEEAVAIEMAASYTTDYFRVQNLTVAMSVEMLSEGFRGNGVLVPINAERALTLLRSLVKSRSQYEMVNHRGYQITFNPKPIPDRDFDFDFAHIDYDGPGDHRSGHGDSIKHCMIQIDDQVEEQNE